ncbi:hypothetical protein LXL04_007515 [Taraxacum kok-saghyz]
MGLKVRVRRDEALDPGSSGRSDDGGRKGREERSDPPISVSRWKKDLNSSWSRQGFIHRVEEKCLGSGVGSCENKSYCENVRTIVNQSFIELACNLPRFVKLKKLTNGYATFEFLREAAWRNPLLTTHGVVSRHRAGVHGVEVVPARIHGVLSKYQKRKALKIYKTFKG